MQICPWIYQDCVTTKVERKFEMNKFDALPVGKRRERESHKHTDGQIDIQTDR